MSIVGNTNLRTIVKEVATGSQDLYMLQDTGSVGAGSKAVVNKLVFVATTVNPATINLHTNTVSIPIKTVAPVGGVVTIEVNDIYLSNTSAIKSGTGTGVTRISVDTDTATNGRCYISLDVTG